MDGVYALSPIERGVLSVREFEREETLFKVIHALNLEGPAALSLAIKVSTMKESCAAPATDQIAEYFDASRLVNRPRASKVLANNPDAITTTARTQNSKM